MSITLKITEKIDGDIQTDGQQSLTTSVRADW